MTEIFRATAFTDDPRQLVCETKFGVCWIYVTADKAKNVDEDVIRSFIQNAKKLFINYRKQAPWISTIGAMHLDLTDNGISKVSASTCRLDSDGWTKRTIEGFGDPLKANTPVADLFGKSRGYQPTLDEEIFQIQKVKEALEGEKDGKQEPAISTENFPKETEETNGPV